MKHPIISYTEGKCVWTNGKILAKAMQSEMLAHAKRGYFFDYGQGETASFKKYSGKVETHAGFMMQAAKQSAQSVEIFCNMSGEIACRLVREGKAAK